jgi:hypothetical protein
VSNTTPDEVWEKVIPHMGKMGDKSVSALFNGKPSASSIRAKRMKLGIESFQKSPERKDPNDYRFVPNETEKLMQTWKNTNQFRQFMSDLCYNNYSQLVAQFLTPDTSGVAGGHSGPECDRALSFLNGFH